MYVAYPARRCHQPCSWNSGVRKAGRFDLNLFEKKGFKSDVHFQFVLVLSCYLNKILWALVTLFWPNTNRTTYLVENVCSYKTKT